MKLSSDNDKRATGWRRPLRIVLLCDPTWAYQANIIEHMRAFHRFSRHHVSMMNPREWHSDTPPKLDGFDVLVIHYSIWILNENYLPGPVRLAVQSFDGLKVQFLQDEYRQVNAMVAAMIELGTDVLFTVVPEDAEEALYAPLKVRGTRVVRTLTGYVPDGVKRRRVRRIADRHLHVAYRSRPLPFELGRLAREKVEIAERFGAAAAGSGLRCDISWKLEDRIYGRDWEKFQSSAKATLGTGSGASIIDFDGEVEARVTKFSAQHPDATFEDVSQTILAPFEGNAVIDVISPRVFEAVALRTALIMYPGVYSGVVQPGEHYILLEKDLSNFDEVAAKLRDDEFLQRLVDHAYDDIVVRGGYAYRDFVEQFDRVVDEEINTRGDTRTRYPRPVSIALRPAVQALRVPRALAWEAVLSWVLFRWLAARRWEIVYRPFKGPVEWVTFHTHLMLAVAGLLIRDRALRRVVWSALRTSVLPIRRRLQIVLHAARVASARRSRLRTALGRQRLQLSAHRSGESLVLEADAVGASGAPRTDAAHLDRLTADGLHELLVSGVRRVLLDRSGDAKRWPVLLRTPPSFELSGLAELSQEHPGVLADLVSGG